MIQDGKYSAHSCECGKLNRIMEERLKDVSIEHLLGYAQKRMGEKNLAASLMGSVSSEKKTISSRENGKKGGRPKKRK